MGGVRRNDVEIKAEWQIEVLARIRRGWRGDRGYTIRLYRFPFLPSFFFFFRGSGDRLDTLPAHCPLLAGFDRLAGHGLASLIVVDEEINQDRVLLSRRAVSVAPIEARSRVIEGAVRLAFPASSRLTTGEPDPKFARESLRRKR